MTGYAVLGFAILKSQRGIWSPVGHPLSSLGSDTSLPLSMAR